MNASRWRDRCFGAMVNGGCRASTGRFVPPMKNILEPGAGPASL